ncbi:MAG: radical SAM family heme chaperone HemW [Prevotella sp.]|nr:radical SAM family heme chaperone HemW [Prevotella sp.]
MAGIYVHIPFCKSRCIYCGFYSTTVTDQRQRYVDALCREWEIRQAELASDAAIETLYLGGGTPSQLTTPQLEQLMKTVPRASQETTIECNPDDVTSSFASFLPRLGIDRVSMGAQTFDDERLSFLHRRHTAIQVSQAVEHLRQAGIGNISIDLMYGFPGETLSDWQRDIDQALALNVEHISAYCLMVEEGTPLYERLQRKEQSETTRMPDEEQERRMYETLIDRLTEAGYEHYEISNFARPGYRSRHNGSYWNDVPYIGLGAAAHSYDRQRRQWNVSDIRRYMEAIEQGVIPCESELLDDDTRYNDRITTAMRTSDGLDLATLSQRHRSYCLKEAQPYIDDGLLRMEGSHLIITRRGLFVSDMVMSSLMLV